MLCQLILVNGFLTDPDVPGVEKLCAAKPLEKWLLSPLSKINSDDIGGAQGLVGPGSAFMVKGWNRSVCALAILVASYKNLDLFKAAMFASHTQT